MIKMEKSRGKTFVTCQLCKGAGADSQLHRKEVWQNELWRLTTSLSAEILGFSYLEPKRHISDITSLNGEEARTLGLVLSRVTKVLREETDSENVYVYIFGSGIPHLHIHLAPHKPGDALNEQIIRGEVREAEGDSGFVQQISEEFPILPESDQKEVIQRVRERLRSMQLSDPE
jgi:diadenosine tetraphosphate (Ap4A) HIT family hydrolase